MKILFVHQGSRSFFDADIAILKEIAEVIPFDNYPPSWKKAFQILAKLPQCDLVYIWFMGRHAVLPLILAKLFGKKVVLVAGGWDVANCPEIDYGLMRPSSSRSFLKWLFRLPDIILSISKANHQDLLKNTGIDENKTRILYLGFEDPKVFLPAKEKMVVTVGEVSYSNLARKGLETFVRAAAHFPDVRFALIGKWSSDGAIIGLKSIATANVEFTGPLSNQDLSLYLGRAQAYAQLSYHEAFGAALAEAMLHECVPVITTQYSLPEVGGDAAYSAPLGNMNTITEAIRKALADPAAGQKARARVLDHFSLSRRRQELNSLIREILSRG